MTDTAPRTPGNPGIASTIASTIVTDTTTISAAAGGPVGDLTETVVSVHRHTPTVMLTNRQKVAVILAQLGQKKAAPLLRELSDPEAITLTTEIANLPPSTPRRWSPSSVSSSTGSRPPAW